MPGTNIVVIAESRVKITFHVDSNVLSASQNIVTLLKRRGRTSSTIMAGLLTITSAHPIRQEHMQCPYIMVNFPAKVIEQGYPNSKDARHYPFPEIDLTATESVVRLSVPNNPEEHNDDAEERIQDSDQEDTSQRPDEPPA